MNLSFRQPPSVHPHHNNNAEQEKMARTKASLQAAARATHGGLGASQLRIIKKQALTEARERLQKRQNALAVSVQAVQNELEQIESAEKKEAEQASLDAEFLQRSRRSHQTRSNQIVLRAIAKKKLADAAEQK